MQPNHIGVAALAWADEPRQQFDSRDFRQSLITIAQRTGDARRIETGACRFSKGARFWPERRPRWWQRDVCDAGSRRSSRLFRRRALVLRSFRFRVTPRRQSRAVAAVRFWPFPPTKWVERVFAIFFRPQMRSAKPNKIARGLRLSGHAPIRGYDHNGERREPGPDGGAS